MDLQYLGLAAPDVRGLRVVLGIRKDAPPAAVDPNLLRLIPGTRVERGKLLLPCNVLPGGASASHPQEPVAQRVKTTSGLRLRGYQLEGIQFIEDTPLGCMVCDDTGVGKTNTAAAFASIHPELRPILVVGPLISTGAWVGDQADPYKHFGLRLEALRSRRPGGEVDRSLDGYFCNYQILAPWKEKLHNPDGSLQLALDGKPVVDVHPGWGVWVMTQLQPKLVIVDESHECRNYRNTYAKTVHKICRALPHNGKRIFLSATPVVNYLVDLWYQLDCVQPGLWGHLIEHSQAILTSFGSRYCNAQHNGYGWDLKGESNVAELRSRLTNVMIRRSRFDVRKELPPFERQRTSVPTAALDQAAYNEYKLIADATVEAVRAAAGGVLQGHELQRLTGMFNHLSWAKRDVAVQHAAQLARTAKKVVVFTWFKRTASHIVKALKKQELRAFGPVTGEMLIAKRNHTAEEFKSATVAAATAGGGGAGCGAVFVATLGAAGQSLNPLSAASRMLFVDLHWVPALLLQAEGRCHREGQLDTSVLAQYLFVDGTIDQIMWSHLERKAKQIMSATQDAAATSLVETLGGRNDDERLQALVRAMAGLTEAAMELT